MRRCSVCGVFGHTRVTCKQRAQIEARIEMTQPPGELSVSEWGSVRGARGRGKLSLDIAEQMGAKLHEVNMAYCSPTYKDYVAIRKHRARWGQNIDKDEESKDEPDETDLDAIEAEP